MKLNELFEAEERSILSVMGKQEDVFQGHFQCDGKRLTSLEGSPDEVFGDFFGSNNRLTSLRGGPSKVGGNCLCHQNQLTSLEGVPETVKGNFSCHKNNLSSLKGIHKQIKHIGNVANFRENPIKSHMLGLLKISGLKRVLLADLPVEKIINKYLLGDRDIFACQEELIEAGFPEFAQL